MLAGFLVVIVGFFSYLFMLREQTVISPLGKKIRETVKPLEKYSFNNLRQESPVPAKIVLGEVINEDQDFVSQYFYFTDNGKKVSGMLNAPKAAGEYPVIIMLRGFVSKEMFETGTGTKRAGEVFAKNGFITLAPDFLGYGQSDNPSSNSIEERFQTYTTTLSLLSSLQNLNSGLEASYSGQIRADTEKTGIWGHSNGGHIALSILAITGKKYPTVVWAPVSKPFPYSILYFTDEFDDHGKALRKVVADFEKDYDVELYSPTNYYRWIIAPIQIHQGVQDDAVPVRWSDQLVEQLEKLKRDVEYFTYQSADHNLMPDGWGTAVTRSMEFYQQHFQD